MKTLVGKVISKKMDKTTVVEVVRYRVHPIYKKRLLRTKRYHVHDELGSRLGDKVEFTPCRPYSKTKKWKIDKILKKAKKEKK